jgi:hypothetical protein
MEASDVWDKESGLGLRRVRQTLAEVFWREPLPALEMIQKNTWQKGVQPP